MVFKMQKLISILVLMSLFSVYGQTDSSETVAQKLPLTPERTDSIVRVAHTELGIAQKKIAAIKERVYNIEDKVNAAQTRVEIALEKGDISESEADRRMALINEAKSLAQKAINQFKIEEEKLLNFKDLLDKFPVEDEKEE